MAIFMILGDTIFILPDERAREALKKEIKNLIRQMATEAAETQLDCVSGSQMSEDFLKAYKMRLAQLDEILNPPWISLDCSRKQLVKEIDADLDRAVDQVAAIPDKTKKPKRKSGKK